MSRTNGRRTDKSSYSNPKSKARSRKEHSKKIENKQYQSSTKQMNKKSVSNENKKFKVKMSSTYGKVCKKLPEAKKHMFSNKNLTAIEKLTRKTPTKIPKVQPTGQPAPTVE